MPVLKSRYDHVKVYRPRGTLTASARATGDLDEAIYPAIRSAIEAFTAEFGRPPEQERLVIEVVGCTFAVVVDVIETPEE